MHTKNIILLPSNESRVASPLGTTCGTTIGLLCALLLCAAQLLSAQPADARSTTYTVRGHDRLWHIQPECSTHVAHFVGRAGLPITDEGAEQAPESAHPAGYNAWRAVGSERGFICKGLAVTLPEDVRGSMLTVQLRMRLPEAPMADAAVRPVVHVVVIESGTPRIDQIITTDAPKTLTSGGIVQLGSDNLYGDVPVGQWRYGGGPIDIRVEYAGVVPLMLDYISIGE